MINDYFWFELNYKIFGYTLVAVVVYLTLRYGKEVDDKFKVGAFWIGLAGACFSFLDNGLA